MMISSLRPTRGHLGVYGLTDGGGEALPAGDLFAELPAAFRGELVVLGVAVVLGDPPARFDPPFPAHAVERGIERALLDAEHVVGGGLDPAGDPVAMHRAPGERLENEELDRALQEAGVFGEHIEGYAGETGTVTARGRERFPLRV